MLYENTLTNWASAEDIDWTLVREKLGEYLRGVIRIFGRQEPEAVVYGIVIVHGQNWELSVYLNTEGSIAGMPARFRAQSNWPAKTDQELIEILGRWSYDDWEYGLYEFQCGPETKAINDIHYAVFGRFFDEADGSGHDDLSDHFLQACAGAVVSLERSSELGALQKTGNFKIRFFDANCYGWDTASIMDAARQ